MTLTTIATDCGPLPAAVPAPGEPPADSLRRAADADLRAPDAPAREMHERSVQAAEAGRRVARNLGVLVGGQAITWTVTLVWTVIVPRALGPVGLGILVAAQSVSGVLGIVLGMGTRNYLVREAVINPADGPRLVGTALILRIAVAPIVGLAAVVWASVAGYGHQASTVLYLITAMTVLTLITEPLQAAFQAIERMKYLAYADIINKSAQSLIGIGLVLIGFKVVGIAANMAIMAVVVLVLTFWWLRPHFVVDFRTSPTRMGHMLKQSMAYWAFGLFGMVYFWIDTIMLSLLTRPEVVGWYGVTSQLFQTLMFLPVLVQTAWLPRLVAAFVRGRRELVETARGPVELVLVISVPIAVATGLVAAPLIHAVYGAQFAPAVPVMVILAMCIPPIYLNIVLASVLLAAKRQRVWTIVMAGAAVINPLFNLVLIPLTSHRYHNGAIGASIALVLTEVLMDAVGFVLVGRDVFDRHVVKRCALVCVACAGMAGVTYAARPLGSELSLLAGFATFGVLVLLLRIVKQEEFAMVRAGLARVVRGVGRPGAGRPAGQAGAERSRPRAEPDSAPARLLEGDSPASLDDAFAIERSLPAGHVNAALAMARRLELCELLEASPSRERDLCMAMILGRVICAGSKLGTLRTLRQTTLAGELGIEEVGQDDLDAAMDWLLERSDLITDRLAARHFADGELALYDVFFSEFDGRARPPGGGDDCRRSEHGCAELVYGLACDADGRPVAIELLTGRRDRDTSLPSQIGRLRRRFGLSRVVVVADCGMLTPADLERLSETDGLDWVTALQSSTTAGLVEAGIARSSMSEERCLWEISGNEPRAGERLIGRRDPSVGAQRARKREELLAATEADLARIAERVNRGTLRGADRIWRAVGPALNRYRMRGHFQVTITPTSFAYSRDPATSAAAAALDGFTILRTSLTETTLATGEVARAYRNLEQAERALGSSEGSDREGLPIQHQLEDRLQAHALICMLAYYLTWHLQAAWEPLLAGDDVHLARSHRALLAELATQTRNTTRVRPDAGTVDKLTRPTALQAEALDLAARAPVVTVRSTRPEREKLSP